MNCVINAFAIQDLCFNSQDMLKKALKLIKKLVFLKCCKTYIPITFNLLVVLLNTFCWFSNH